MRPSLPSIPLLLLCTALLAFAGCSGAGAGEESVGPDGGDDTAPDASASDAGLQDDGGDPDAVPDTADDADAGERPVFDVLTITVTLDGEPAPDAIVIQGGTGVHYQTGVNGTVELPLDPDVVGTQTVIASHPEARTGYVEVAFLPSPEAAIALRRYDASDNPDYEFQDPGEPRRRPTTAQCAHCHQTIGDAWYNSVHRTAASNPFVHDWFSGAAHRARDAEACEALGGVWLPGREPGTGESVERCYVGRGALAAYNPDCDDDGSSCDDAPDGADCADCHAPATTGPNGEIGGQHLLDATGFAHDYGVFCDVCHRVDRVVPTSDEPGVGGRLVLTRPSEASSSPALGTWLPLTFGPSHDSPNIRMGSVQRDHYRDGSLCGGCHELHATPVVGDIDRERWPDGRLPLQTTHSEWESGVLGDAAVCNDCHMPPEPVPWNAADLQRAGLAEVGVQGGWFRPPGAVRQHSWIGPRSPASRMLEHAAALFIDKEVVDGELVARVTTRNVGAGHAIPTGEPMRSMILLVEASCGDTTLEATGGHAVPDTGGARRVQGTADDWTRWPDARPGDRVRVVERTGAWHDYPGWGPFGDGTFDPVAKGMPVELVAGTSVITAVEDGAATFDRPLATGDLAYLIGADSGAWAGAPGFAFARVTVGPDGARNVPHFLAVDIASDNRLAPQASWTSEHRFGATCAEPTVTARLVYRRFAYDEAVIRDWPLEDRVIAEVSR